MNFLLKIIFSILTLFSIAVYAQPVELVVTYPPGGAVDIFARNFQKYLNSADVSSLVVNKSGSDGKIGINYVLTKNTDNTVLVAATGPILFNKVLYANNNYDYSQFEMSVPMARTPLVVAVSTQSGITSWTEFLEQGKSRKLNCGVSNSGSGFAGRYFVKKLELSKTEIIPFKGAADVTSNLIGGSIDCAVDPLSTLANAHRDNKIKIIAVATQSKHPDFPQIPLIKQSIKDFDFYYWFGIGVVKGHQFDSRVFTLASQAYKDSAMTASLKLLEFEMIKPPADSQKFLDAEYNKFEDMRRHIGLEKVTN